MSERRDADVGMAFWRHSAATAAGTTTPKL